MPSNSMRSESLMLSLLQQIWQSKQENHNKVKTGAELSSLSEVCSNKPWWERCQSWSGSTLLSEETFQTNNCRHCRERWLQILWNKQQIIFNWNIFFIPAAVFFTVPVIFLTLTVFIASSVLLSLIKQLSSAPATHRPRPRGGGDTELYYDCEG